MKHFIFGRAKSVHIQFLRYFFVGGSSAVIDILVYTILITTLSVHYAFAAFFGYMFGLSWNYTIGLFWVFERRHGRAKEILMVFLIALGGLFWTWILLFIMIDLMGMDAIISKLISQIIVLLWNFGMRKYYVFN